MEAVVANLTEPGRRALVVVTGYFGDRLAQMFARYGAAVDRLDVEWGRAVDPAAVERALAASRADIVAIVHGETSTGVLQSRRRRRRGSRARTMRSCVVDAVTTMGAVELEVGAWGIDACYSCSQKGLGRALGNGAGRVLEARARSPRDLPQLLSRPRAARGLLAAAQVSPHDFRAARLRACTPRSAK